MTEKMRVLLTGGAGYVGSHSAWMLHIGGHEIWAFDNLSEGHRDAVPEGRLIEGVYDGASSQRSLSQCIQRRNPSRTP